MRTQGSAFYLTQPQLNRLLPLVDFFPLPSLLVMSHEGSTPAWIFSQRNQQRGPQTLTAQHPQHTHDDALAHDAHLTHSERKLRQNWTITATRPKH